MSSVYTLPNGSDFLLRVDYTKAEANGVLALIFVSGLSAIAVIGLLIAITISAFNTSTKSYTNSNLFVRTHVAAYFVSLLLCDLLQAAGSIMNIKWVILMSVHFEGFCTLQGILKQTSDVGTALWTLVIAIHTFCILFLQIKLKGYVLWAVLISGWSAIAAVVIAGPAALDTTKRGPFFGISGYWCWVTAEYQVERVTLDYVVMFMSAVLSFILYSLVFFRLRGNIVVDGWYVRLGCSSVSDSGSWRGRQFGDTQMMAIARQMLLYPIAYTILILPIAAARFSQWSGHDVPFAVTIFGDAVFLLSGLVNAVLFTTTRRILPACSIFPKFISKPRLEVSTNMIEHDAQSYREATPVEKVRYLHPPLPPPACGLPATPDVRNSQTVSELSVAPEHTAPHVEPPQSEFSPTSVYLYEQEARGVDSVYAYYYAD